MVDHDCAAAAEVLRRGGLVGMPTETVYGLAANALDPIAVARVFAAKGRPTFDPLIVHVADPEDAWTVAIPSARALRLAAACWPGPLTLVLPRRAHVPDLVTSGLDTVAVRCPDHALARQLIRLAGVPLAAPSANRFGRLSPTTAAMVREGLGAAVAVVVDGGPCRVGVESTVLRPDPLPVILRPGGCTREELEAILGEPVALADREQRAGSLPREAPGMLASHYAPRATVVLREPGQPWPPADAYLAFAGNDLPAGVGFIALSPERDVVKAAAMLFTALRDLDAGEPVVIAAELVPNHGLGVAINDRLRRAAGLG